MNKFFIISLVVTYISAISCKSKNTLDIEGKYKYIPVSASCLTKANVTFTNCVNTVKNKWDNSGLLKQINDAYDKNDNDLANELLEHLSCCEDWDGYDCVLKTFKVCTEKDQKAAKKYIDFVINVYLQSCQEYPYHSSKCGNTKEDSTSTVSPVTENCMTKATNAVGTCKTKVAEKMARSDLSKQVDDAIAKNDQAKADELGIQISCCTSYKGFDCIEDVIKGCTTEDQKSAKASFDKMIKQLEGGKCEKYKYHSGQCGGQNGSSGSWLISANFFAMTLAILNFIL